MEQNQNNLENTNQNIEETGHPCEQPATPVTPDPAADEAPVAAEGTDAAASEASASLDEASASSSEASDEPQEVEVEAEVQSAATEPDQSASEKPQKAQKAKKEKKKKQQEPEAEQADAGKRRKAKKQRRPRKKRILLRVIGAMCRFTLTLLLGMAIAYGSIFGAVYFAVSGLTIDMLQKMGIANGVDAYLKDTGDIDLTSTSILELVADLNAVRADLQNHTLQSLIEHYGITLPEETMQKLPTDLFAIPLDQLIAGDTGTIIAENLKFGYILSLLPSEMLSSYLIDTLAERPLALLTKGEYGELFAGVKLGYLMGVSFDESGRVVPVDAANPTLQEVIADLDLGKLLTAATQNGDLLGVLATDLGDNEVRSLLSGIVTGALLDKMCEGRYLKDVILLDQESGRYNFDLLALTGSLHLGDMLDYTYVNGTWYTEYTDNGNADDDVKAPKMNATLASLSLTDVLNGTISLEASFEDVYFGDLQSGYVRGTEIKEAPAEGGEPVVVGYEWLKEGKAVGKMQQQLANVAVNDLLNGQLDLNKILGTLSIGDLQGYTRRDVLDAESGAVIGHEWLKERDGTAEPVSAMLAAIADISVSDILNGKMDIATAMGDLKLGDVQGYKLGDDGLWYREVADAAGGTPTLEYVGAVKNDIADIVLSDVLNGKLDIADALGGLKLGDVQGYKLGDDGLWYREIANAAGGAPTLEYVGAVQNSIASVLLSDLLNGKLDITATMGDLKLGDVQGYTLCEDGLWYRKVTDAETGAITLEYVGAVQNSIADMQLSDLLNGNMNITDAMGDLKLGDVQGYTLGDDGLWYREVVDAETGAITLEYVGAVQNSIANVLLSDVLNGKMDIAAALGDLKLGDVQGYTLGDDGLWYREITDVETGTITREYVGAVQNSIANVPLSDVMNGEFDLADAVDGLRMGDAMSYERGEVTTPADPEDATSYEKYAFTKKDNETGETVPVTGTMLEIANLPLTDVLNGKVDFEDTVRSMTLAEALNYTWHDGAWYSTYTDNGDDTDDVKVTGVLAVLADKRINELNNETIDVITFGEILGYTLVDEDGDGTPETWYDGDKPATGMMKVFADLTLGGISNDDTVSAKIRELTLAEALDYTWHNGAWYSTYTDNGDDTDDVKVTGVLAVLADKRINELNNETIDAIAFGEILGYTLVDEDGDGIAETWYDGDAPATGMMKVFADLTLGGLADDDAVAAKIRELTLADAMGYKLVNGVWYSTYSDDGDDTNDVPLTGILKVLAAKRLDEINNATIDAIAFGEILGYTLVDEDGDGIPETWYDGDAPATGMMKVFADLTIGGLSDDDLVAAKIRELTLADAMGYKLVNGVWYSAYSDDGDDTNDVPLTGILNILAAKRLDEIDNATIDAITFGEILGYTLVDEDGDGIPETWYDGDTPATGMMKVFADLTIGGLSDDDAVAAKIRELTLADAMGYKLVNGVWYSAYSDDEDDTNDVPLTGILKVLAAKRLDEINTDTIDTILLGDAIGYTFVDTDENGVADTWYVDGAPAKGIMATMADLAVGQLKDPNAVSDKIGEVKLYEVLNYKYENGKWISADGSHVASGVMAHLMDIAIGNIEHKIDKMPLGYAFGFYYDVEDEKWYTDPEHTQEPTGVTAALADIELTHAREEFDELKIGRLLGYTYDDTNGDEIPDTWHNNGAELTGLNLVFADLLVSDLGNSDKVANAMQQAKLGDSLGYRKVNGTWYKTKTDSEGNVSVDMTAPVTGLVGALADTKIGGIEENVQTVLIGNMLNFTERDGVWYDEEGNKVTGAVTILAKSNLNTLSDNINNMTVNDLWGSKDDRKGILKAVDGSTRINELDSAIEQCSVGDLIEAGVLQIHPLKAAALDLKLPGWRTLGAIEFINALLNIV